MVSNDFGLGVRLASDGVSHTLIFVRSRLLWNCTSAVPADSRTIPRLLPTDRTVAVSSSRPLSEEASSHDCRGDPGIRLQTWPEPTSDVLAPLLVIEEDHLRQGLRLFERHLELVSFAAVLAAAAIAVGADALVSADQALAVVEGLRHVDPAEAIRTLLRG